MHIHRYIILFILIISQGEAQFVGSNGNVESEEQTKQEIGDSVRSIRVEVIDSAENTVRINWIPTGIDEQYILARSSNGPISTAAEMYNAEPSWVIEPGRTSKIDNGLSPGSYYYAIIAKRQLKENRALFFAGENYTAQALVIGSRVRRASAGAPSPVSLIFAQLLSDGQVRVSWRGINTPNTSYNLYRSSEPLKDSIALSKSKLIATVSENISFYIDRLASSGIYYYAVTSVSSNGIENRILTADRSYTSEGIRYNVVDLPVISYIDASRSSQNSIAIKWRDIGNTRTSEFTYVLYRSQKQFGNMVDLESAVKLGSIRQGVEFYLDNSLGSGSYFYALVTVNTLGLYSNRFIPGANVTSRAISLHRAVINEDGQNYSNENSNDQDIFTSISAYDRDNGVLVTWRSGTNLANTVATGGVRNARIQIYRFRKKPRAIRDLVYGVLVAKVSSDRTIYEDTPAERGIYYYSLFLETNSGLKPTTMTNKNLVGPISFQYARKRFEPSLYPKKKKVKKEKVNAIIKATYLVGRYRLAVQKLSPYLRSRSKLNRAKAAFYCGLSYYRLKKYSKALEYFVDPLVSKAYGSRARFWYSKTLLHLK